VETNLRDLQLDEADIAITKVKAIQTYFGTCVSSFQELYNFFEA